MASPLAPASPSAKNATGDGQQILRQLRLLEEEHQHEVGRKVELERTIENQRSQLRSLSVINGADKRQVEVLRAEIDALRGLLQGKPLPPPSVELKQVEAARAVSEARADAAAAQLEDVHEAMQIGLAERARLAEEVTLLRAQLTASTDEKLEAQRAAAEMGRSLRSLEQRAAAHEAQAQLLQGRADAARDRAERASATVSELRRQLDASQAESAELSRANAEARALATAAAASSATEASSRAELQSLLAAAEARLTQQAQVLNETRQKAARVEAGERAAADAEASFGFGSAGGDGASAAAAAAGSGLASGPGGLRPALVDALANAERAAGWARAALDEERFERRAAEGRAAAAEAEGSARRAREEALDEQLGALAAQLRQADGEREAARRELDGARDRMASLEAEAHAAGQAAQVALSKCPCLDEFPTCAHDVSLDICSCVRLR